MIPFKYSTITFVRCQRIDLAVILLAHYFLCNTDLQKERNIVNNKRRIEEFDIIKGIAIIYVFMRHLCELTGVNVYAPGFYSFFNKCTESFMLLFVLLSGYVFKSKGSIKLDIKNKFKQLLIPYLAFSAFFSVTYFIRYVLLSDMAIGLFVRNTLSNFLAYPNLDIPALGTGPNVMTYAFVPYWYIAEIFMAFLLFIVINKLIENKNVYIKMGTAAILLGLSALIMHLDVRGLLVTTFASKASYFTVVPNIVGFSAILLIGTIMRHYNLLDMEAHSKRFTIIFFIVCLIQLCVVIALYDNQYALQYGKWGQFGLWSVRVTTVSGFTLTYCLTFIGYYLKQIRFIKIPLAFLGGRTLDILLLHFGIAELVCMIFGFWYPVYQIEHYPADGYAWWHLVITVLLTALCIAAYFVLKNILKKRKKCN